MVWCILRFVRFPTVLADLVLFGVFLSQMRGGAGGPGWIVARVRVWGQAVLYGPSRYVAALFFVIWDVLGLS